MRGVDVAQIEGYPQFLEESRRIGGCKREGNNVILNIRADDVSQKGLVNRGSPKLWVKFVEMIVFEMDITKKRINTNNLSLLTILLEIFGQIYRRTAIPNANFQKRLRLTLGKKLINSSSIEGRAVGPVRE